MKLCLQARKLESDLEIKLAAYSKMANRLDHLGQGEAGLAADQVISASCVHVYRHGLSLRRM
jgi:hypothetical protein